MFGRAKWALIVIVVLWADTSTGVAERHRGELDALRATVEQQRSELAALRLGSSRTRERYRSGLQNIVASLHEKEQYRYTGGNNVDTVQDLDVLYEAIMNGTTDYDQLLQDVSNYFDARKEYLNDIPNVWPLRLGELNRITSPYGYRISPFTGLVQWHKGIDITGEARQQILTTANGVVTDVWIHHPVYGKMVNIDHQNGFETLYAHLSQTWVREGQRVERGQIIGLMGNSGLSKGYHLHYEVRRNGVLRNPMEFLATKLVGVLDRSPHDRPLADYSGAEPDKTAVAIPPLARTPQ